jgi:hypothetical protein
VSWPNTLNQWRELTMLPTTIKQYTTSDKTNVMETWKRFGFIPPSESAEYQKKWTVYRYSINVAEFPKLPK